MSLDLTQDRLHRDEIMAGRQRIMRHLPRALFAAIAIVLATSTSAFAQWQTQTITLNPGWNAVYLHIDASHASVEKMAPEPIQEVWLWQPKMSEGRFINDPQQPVTGDDWSSWNRSGSGNNSLDKLNGNAAYLIRNGSTADYTWSVKGKPVPTRYDWTSKGVNLIGFATPASSPPSFSTFLTPVNQLATQGEFYRYDDKPEFDGFYDLTPGPFKSLLSTVKVNRGQAFWIRHPSEFNRYFGAFEISLQNSSGIHFGDSVSQYSLRVRNLTAQTITLTTELLFSEADPDPTVVPPVPPLPPLLLRGELNANDLTYAFDAINSNPQTVTLKPKGQVGSEVELILGVNRVAMTGSLDTLYAGILRLTDSLAYSQVDLPVSARPSTTAGLWVGNAVVDQVRHSLKNYQRDQNNQPVLAQIDLPITGSDTAGLLLEMRLDEGSGTTAHDSAPGDTRRDGTLKNDPLWLVAGNGPPTDSERPALRFDAAKEQYVDLGAGVVLGNTFTEEAWIYPTANDALHHGFLGFQSGTDQRAPSLWIFNTNQIAFYHSDGANVRHGLTKPALTRSQWNHVAVTCDGTDFKFYVNGNEQELEVSNFAQKPLNNLPVRWIGRVNDYFPGRIAQVRLWNVARTKEQIRSAMYRSQLTPPLSSPYVVISTNTSLGTVGRPFPLRLILHNNGSESQLLQRVYHGLDRQTGTNSVLVTHENLLHLDFLAQARRISAAHLPWSSGNSGWLMNGQFAQGQILATTDAIRASFDDHAANPFLHSFHPDHDNLNATFDGSQARGVESYDIERRIKLTFSFPGSDFASLIAGGTQMTGKYEEEILLSGRGNESRRIDTAGFFLLKRISDIKTLTTQ